MKKLLLAPALLLAISSANAQLAMENFNAAGVPAGWTRFSDGSTVSTTISPTYIQALLNANSWAKFTRAAGDSAMISTSFYTTTGVAADRWLVTPSFNVTSPTMILSFDMGDLSTSGTSPVEVKVSTTGGATKADFTTSLGTITCGAGFIKLGADLGAFNGQNIKVAFVNNGTAKGFPGVDNVQTEILPNALDGSADAVTFPSLVSATSSTPVRMTISNKGAKTITSLQLSYTLDATTPVMQTFSALSIPPFGSTTVTFSTNITSPTIGNHTILGTILQVNGTVDPIATNNTKTIGFAVASKSVNRSGLMEEFTSSTCPPCASFNVSFDPLLLAESTNIPTSRFNAIKYQMNWPSPGNDASYNSQADMRKSYYTVGGIPDHFTNGAIGGAGNAAEIASSKTAPAYMDIKVLEYTIKKDSLISEIEITPYFTLTGVNHKVHMASVERQYTNMAATTSQKEYYYVMRNMAGAGSGISVSSWTANTPKKFRWAIKWTTGTVAQMSSTYWKHAIGSDLVAFVQDESDKSVFQSNSSPAKWPLSVETTNAVISHTSVYPNPAVNHTSIAFKLETASLVGVQVLDQMGRVVYTIAEQKMSAGTQSIEIPTTSFASGVYTLNLQAESKIVSERFSVIK